MDPRLDPRRSLENVSLTQRGTNGTPVVDRRNGTLTMSATWRSPFKRRRCLVPVDGFYRIRAFSRPTCRHQSATRGFVRAGVYDPPWLQTGVGCGLLVPLPGRLKVIVFPGLLHLRCTKQLLALLLNCGSLMLRIFCVVVLRLLESHT